MGMGDALALSYALPVAPTRHGFKGAEHTQTDYNPYD